MPDEDPLHGCISYIPLLEFQLQSDWGNPLRFELHEPTPSGGILNVRKLK